MSQQCCLYLAAQTGSKWLSSQLAQWAAGINLCRKEAASWEIPAILFAPCQGHLLASERQETRLRVFIALQSLSWVRHKDFREVWDAECDRGIPRAPHACELAVLSILIQSLRNNKGSYLWEGSGTPEELGGAVLGGLESVITAARGALLRS